MSLRVAVLLLVLSLVPRPGWSQDAPQAPDAARPKVAGVDVPAPKRTKSVPPHYPPEAQALGMRGIVILELLVGPDGKVVSARITRSVPPFDDAALTAAREWEYEITKVDGKPVSVILTVPIEFKMKLPEMSRDDGIPELRQGVVPAIPAGAGPDTATVIAEVTLDPDGHVAEARIKSGESPWAESVIQALRTWRFSPLEGQGVLSFEVKAEFATSGKSGARVDLRLSGPRRTEAPPPAEAAPSPAAASAPSPSPAAASAPSPAAAASTTPTPAPTAPAASPSPSPVPEAAPAAPPSPAPARPAAPVEEVIRNPAGGKPATPAPPATGVPPATGQPPPPAVPGEPSAAVSPAPATPPPPPPPGISAVRDVTLAPGVPDLTKGRRPVAPPLARMQGVSGTVDVKFAVDASGSATVRDVTGPDPLKEAARQTVASWTFRRTSPERLFLAATVTYKGDTASAAVKPQDQ